MKQEPNPKRKAGAGSRLGLKLMKCCRPEERNTMEHVNTLKRRRCSWQKGEKGWMIEGEKKMIISRNILDFEGEVWRLYHGASGALELCKKNETEGERSLAQGRR